MNIDDLLYTFDETGKTINIIQDGYMLIVKNTNTVDFDSLIINNDKNNKIDFTDKNFNIKGENKGEKISVSFRGTMLDDNQTAIELNGENYFFAFLPASLVVTPSYETDIYSKLIVTIPDSESKKNPKTLTYNFWYTPHYAKSNVIVQEPGDNEISVNNNLFCSKDKPLILRTVRHLTTLSQHDTTMWGSNFYYKQEANINFNNKYTSHYFNGKEQNIDNTYFKTPNYIGNSSNPFKGSYDSSGYSIIGADVWID
jgi:hypothetical protein